MSDSEKVFTYDEAKELCRKAFNGGTMYGGESVRDGTNAVAYDWNHWFKDHEHQFMSAPTVEDVLREFAKGLGVPVADSYIAVTAARRKSRRKYEPARRHRKEL